MSKKGSRRAQVPPLRTCVACGKRFRSWSIDRYCQRRKCRESANAAAYGQQLTLDSGGPIPPAYDPSKAPFPEGY